MKNSLFCGYKEERQQSKTLSVHKNTRMTVADVVCRCAKIYLQQLVHYSGFSVIEICYFDVLLLQQFLPIICQSSIEFIFQQYILPAFRAR